MAVETILVIDDSMSSRLVLSKMLKQYDVTINMTGSVDEAFEILKNNRPDAIFLDRYMPGTSGLQALKLLQEKKQTANIPVVMFTSLGPDDDPEDLLEPGALAVLPKPFTEDALFQIMQQLNEVKDNGGQLPRSRLSKKNATPQIDLETLQPLIQSVLDDALQQRVMPLLKDNSARWRAQQSAQLTEPMRAQVEAQMRATLGPALQELREQLNAEQQQQIEQLRESYQQQLQQLRDSVEQHDAPVVVEVQSEEDPDHPHQDGDDASFYVMDSIVAENANGEEAWREAEQSATGSDDLDVADSDAEYHKETGMPKMSADPQRRLALLGAGLVVVIAVAVLYFVRSM